MSAGALWAAILGLGLALMAALAAWWKGRSSLAGISKRVKSSAATHVEAIRKHNTRSQTEEEEKAKRQAARRLLKAIREMKDADRDFMRHYGSKPGD